MSYNILDGGEGRADPLAEVIEAQQPDVVVLIEADNADVVERIGRRLKMDAIVGEGRKHSAAILSRWPIMDSVNHGLLRQEITGCLLEASIAQPGGAELTVAAVHLHPRAADADETVREKEIEAILEIYAKHRAGHKAHIFAGDFNANSPIQIIDAAKCKPRTQREMAENGGVIPRRAIKKLLKAGYVDTLQAVAPGAAETAGTFSTQFPGQRVDYVFTHGIELARIKEVRVEQDRLAQFASDHFPVVASIE